MKLFFSNKNTRVIDTIVTNIKSEDILNNKTRANKLLKMFSYEFLNMQYSNGIELLNFAKENNIPMTERDNYVLFNHSKGSAMINVYLSYDMQISPAIFYKTNNFINEGGYFSTGNFSDVDFVASSNTNFFFVVTTDTLPIHNLYLVWVIDKLEKTFYDDKFEIKDVDYSMSLSNYHKNLFDSLYDEIIKSTMRNKEKRIDSLVIKELIDGQEVEMTVKQYIKYYTIYRNFCTNNTLLKMCIKYGKPYAHMKAYIRKYGF